jgi:hypothetical protein
MTELGSQSLNSLFDNLGIKDSIDLIIFALPHITERRNALKQFLVAGEWEAAARVAHKTLSSVRLYSSGELEKLLQYVCQQDIKVISTSDFQRMLDDEFSSNISILNRWVSSMSV